MRSVLALTLLLAACAPSSSPRDAAADDRPAAPAPPAAAPASAASAEGDSARIARLEREARALAHAEGCTAGECRTAPVGSRPCGGPRTYVAYCAASTDSAALFAKLAELARAEEAFNSANGMMSTCEFREPPTVAVEGGRCVTRESQELPVQ
jgi:hypothetical protein